MTDPATEMQFSLLRQSPLTNYGTPGNPLAPNANARLLDESVAQIGAVEGGTDR